MLSICSFVCSSVCRQNSYTKKRFSQNVYLLCCILMRNKVYNPELGERESCCSYNSVLSSYRIYTFFRLWLPEACSFTGMTCVTFGNQSIIRIDCHMTINCFNCCSCRHISSVNTLTVLCLRGLDFQTLLNSKYSFGKMFRILSSRNDNGNCTCSTANSFWHNSNHRASSLATCCAFFECMPT